MTRLVFERDQPHIRSPFATAAPTSRLRQEDEKFQAMACFGSSTWIVRTNPVLGITARAYRHAVFITSPSMTTPAVTHFQCATSSFRATDTEFLIR
jgi:hypothetical protein